MRKVCCLVFAVGMLLPATLAVRAQDASMVAATPMGGHVAPTPTVAYIESSSEPTVVPTSIPNPPTSIPEPPTPTPEPTSTPVIFDSDPPTPTVVVDDDIAHDSQANTPGAGSTPQAKDIAASTAMSEQSSSEMTLQGVEASPGGLTCIQTSPGDDIVTAGEYVIFRCDNADDPELRGTAVEGFYLRVLSLTTGWHWRFTYQSDGATSDPATNPGIWRTPTATTIRSSSNVSWIFIALGPDPGMTAPSLGELRFEMLQGVGYVGSGKSYPTPRIATLSATLGSAPACVPTVTAGPLDFGTAHRNEGGYETVDGTLRLHFDTPPDADCPADGEPWMVRLSADEVNRMDDGSGVSGSISADAYTYVGTVAGGSVPGGLVPRASVPLGPAGSSPATIAELTPGGVTGAWDAHIQLSPPSTTPPGTYVGTITIDVSSASE